jgi:guanylate kinase
VSRIQRPKPKPFLMVLSAPSGAGKTTVCRGLLKRHPELRRCVTATTRPPRGKEKNGRDYYFLSRKEFQRRYKAGGFYECAEVAGHFYGTPKAEVENSLERGNSLVLVIDVQGGAEVRTKRPDSVLVFLMPPSFHELRKRLRSRGTDSAPEIRRRLGLARREIRASRNYEYVVLNDELTDAVRQVSVIYQAEKLKQKHQVLGGQTHV